VFTWSRGAWLAAIISTFIFFIIYNKKTFRIFGVALFVIPIIPIVMPSNVLNRFLSIADLSDSSISYRIYTWRGTVEAIKAHFFSGIGYGNEAFKQVYPQYAYSGMEAAEHSHSLFLQLLLGLGIVGLVIFALITFFALQKLFGYIKKPEDRTSCVYVIATVASLISALIMGIFDNVWYNYRIFYAFWVIVAIGVAFVRVGSYEMDRNMDLTNGTL
jgi:putative inorganic carbon (HCO3(-)) transporter